MLRLRTAILRPPISLRAPLRAFRVSAAARNAENLKQAAAVEETEDVRELARLLRTVKQRADPASNYVVPMRGAIPWAQALLETSSSPSSEGHETPSPDDLPPRSMHDSYTEVLLPFASDAALFEQYTNASGGIRTGKLLEHLDSLAGSISYKHILGPNVQTLGRIAERGFYVVTAAVDRLDMLAPLKPVRDLRLSGHVIHVGSSSMEVAVRMDALGKNGEETLMLGRFAMVARDAFTHRAHPVNRLVVKTEEEQALYRMGELNKQRRQSQARRSLRLVPPSSTEAEALHSFELQHARHDWSTRPHTQKRVWMEHTRESRTMLMFPQERNVHQKIFGGYLMRLAYELGFTTSRLFTRRPVSFLSLDKISFAKPVPIGSILRLKSEILYTEDNIVHVRVKAMVVEVETGAEQMTNDFRFTWSAQQDASEEKGIPLVVPKTYREAMKWLEGRRALEISANIRRLRAAP